MDKKTQERLSRVMKRIERDMEVSQVKEILILAHRNETIPDGLLPVVKELALFWIAENQRKNGVATTAILKNSAMKKMAVLINNGMPRDKAALEVESAMKYRWNQETLLEYWRKSDEAADARCSTKISDKVRRNKHPK